jgi:hypothetical protein
MRFVQWRSVQRREAPSKFAKNYWQVKTSEKHLFSVVAVPCESLGTPIANRFGIICMSTSRLDAADLFS